MASLVIAVMKIMFLNYYFVKIFVVAAGFLWSTTSSIGFMGGLVQNEKKMLAVYPVFLFYLFLAWFVLVVWSIYINNTININKLFESFNKN